MMKQVLIALACWLLLVPAASRTMGADRGTIRIAVFDFKNVSDVKGLGAEVAEEVRSRLSGLRSRGVQVVEREELYSLIGSEEEYKRSGLMEEDYFDREVAVKGIDAIVTGKVLAMKLASHTERRPMSVRYQSGSRRVPNPKYQQYMQQQRQLQAQQTDPNMRMFAGALGQLGMTQVPQYLNEPVYEVYNYERLTHNKAASFKMSIKMLDNRDGVVLLNRVLTVTAKDRDVEVQADPGKGVAPDPLAIKSDFELSEEVKTKAIDKLTRLVSDALARMTGASPAPARAASPAKAGGSGESDVVAKFKALKSLYDAGLLTEEEYEAKRKMLLDQSF